MSDYRCGDGSARSPRFGLWYHLRNPQRWNQPPELLYRRSLEQAAWAEQIGFESIWASEHHFDADGYLSSPLTFLAAVASRTSRVRMGTNLVIAALHHPLRLAEDTAALAILSDGRFDLGVAAGYREQDFAAFDRRLSHRPSLLDEAVGILRNAWAGTSVASAGRHFTLPDVRVTPIATRPPRLLIGGAATPAVERAAGLADGYLPPAKPLAPLSYYIDPYLDAVQRQGGDPAAATVMCGMPAIVAEDPERTLAQVGEHLLYQVNTYIATGTYGSGRVLETPHDVVTAGYVRLWDADNAIGELSSLLRDYPQVKDVHWWAQLPGESVDSGSERVAYIADKVLPALRGIGDSYADPKLEL
ncbi:LLM class flavin-dependent oxidoreductase [Mycolicibacterium sp. P9-22]|uniref:LLM class flavin-dependent oxidoreductase n=1 Tax=Mycolicibacterium sp. P9-22 TaxID=2024613 RepID=UPI001D14A063|nr:LLM class flavin-dependent oxidoreductase [Mycolicibacterium sp. P9-22]